MTNWITGIRRVLLTLCTSVVVLFVIIIGMERYHPDTTIRTIIRNYKLWIGIGMLLVAIMRFRGPTIQYHIQQLL